MRPIGYITKSEAALVLGCKTRTVDNWMKRKLIPYYKMSRSVFFKRDDILAAVEQFKVPSKAPNTELSSGGPADNRQQTEQAARRLLK